MNRVLLRYELLGLLRDTRTVVLSVFLPVLLLPMLLFGLHKLGQDRFAGAGDTFLVGRPVISKGLEMLIESALSTEPFQETLARDPDGQLSDGSIDLLLTVGTPDKSSPELVRDIVAAFPGMAFLLDKDKSGRPVVELNYRGDRDRSVRAFLAARDRLIEFRGTLVRKFFEKQDVKVGLELESRDVSSVQEKAARKFGPALSSFMILILLGGGSVAALDSLAGERERGTLSTLFLSSLTRQTLIQTKFCVVAIISVVIAVIQVVNLGFCTMIGPISLPITPSPGEGALMLGHLMLLFLAESVFTAALLLYISARSSSFKEAQLFFFPLFLIAFALSLSGMMPGLVSRSVMSLIPLAGPGVLIPEILAGRFDLMMLALQVAVHALATYALLRATLAYVSREEFLAGQLPATGKALIFEQFSSHALPFFAFLGAALMVVPANFAGLSTLTGQGLFNQLVLFGLGPLILLRWYGQRVSVAVPFRRVSLPIVLLCLLLIPLGQLAATGLSHLLAPLLPAPTEAMEQMMKMLDLENTAPWKIYLLIGILPGIFEEFAFRGVLLHALHKRFSPWALAAVVAVVFGFFHLSFFRVVPTAYLGFFLGLITLATGSVWPAMLIHIGNNSLAVYAMLNGWDLEHLSGTTYFICFLGQLVAVGLIIRWGKGYAGTRWAQLDGESSTTGGVQASK